MTLIKVIVLVLVFLLMFGSMAAVPQAQEKKGKEKITEPAVITKINPTYPEDAKKDKVMGIVILEATIGEDGKVVDVTVKKSPDERLSNAAKEAVLQWIFQPAKNKAGKPVKVTSTITVNFKLS
jgi:protein TonB